ncbi:hypothetical protein AMTR_s00053p00163790, partial [Amborella trichopoda]
MVRATTSRRKGMKKGRRMKKHRLTRRGEEGDSDGDDHQIQMQLVVVVGDGRVPGAGGGGAQGLSRKSSRIRLLKYHLEHSGLGPMKKFLLHYSSNYCPKILTTSETELNSPDLSLARPVWRRHRNLFSPMAIPVRSVSF